MVKQLEKLQQTLAYQFSDLDLAQQALTHRSANKPHNERLEFLGDALLGFIIAEALYELHPEASEGELSRMRANIVNKSALAEIAREIELGEFLQLGTGELKSGGMQRDSILADTVEALTAAIYLDGGLAACKSFVKTINERNLFFKENSSKQKDCKTRLQELLQAQGKDLPHYEVVKVSGAAHEQVFHVACKLDVLSEKQIGSGSSKRDAEQRAAEKILNSIERSTGEQL